MHMERNDASHWRAFDQNTLTHSMAHYLMAIDSLRQEFGYARATDVAEMLAVSRGAASMALSQLKKRGWVTEDKNRFLLLTEEGMKISASVENNFVILSKFFETILMVDKDTALGDACKMEHLMSIDTGHHLLWLMRNILADKEISARIRKLMKQRQTGCNPNDVKACPICRDVGECLVSSESYQDAL